MAAGLPSSASLTSSARSDSIGGRAGGDAGDWIVTYGNASPIGGSIPWWFWGGLALAAVIYAKKKRG